MQPLHAGIAAAAVLIPGGVKVAGVHSVEGGGPQLIQRGGAEASLAELHGLGKEVPVPGDQGAHPGAAGGEALGNGVHHDEVLLQPRQGQEGGKGLAAIDELPVDLIRHQEEPVLPGDVGDDGHFLRRQNSAGGVAGVRDENRPGALMDEGLDALALGVAVALLRGAVDGSDIAPRHMDEGIVVGIEGLRDQNLVPFVQKAAHHHLQRLAAAGGGQDVLLRQRRADALIVALHRRHILRHTRGRGVGQHIAAVMAHGVKEGRRRGDIRLTDVQVMDLHAPLLRRQGVGMELAHG